MAASLTWLRRIAPPLACAALGLAGVSMIADTGAILGWLLALFLALGARFLLRPRTTDLALLLRCVGALAVLLALVVAGALLLWESAEVVVLHQKDARGEDVASRLWVVDHGGYEYLSTGADRKRVALAEADPRVQLERAGRTECRRVTLLRLSVLPDTLRRELERLAREKLGFRLYATVVLQRFLGRREGVETMVMRLEPC